MTAIIVASNVRTAGVRNTYTLHRLEQRIRQALPRGLSPVGEAAVAGFLSLTGISRWQPARLGIVELSFVFDIGLPFALIGDAPSVRSIATRVGDAVCAGEAPHPQLWRVVHAAALLRHWGFSVEIDDDRLWMRLPDAPAIGVDVCSERAQGPRDPDTPTLQMVDVCGDSARHGEIAAACGQLFAASPRLVAVVSFEPRFWVSVERKEWIYRVGANPRTHALAGMTPFDSADSGRRVLRVALLE